MADTTNLTVDQQILVSTAANEILETTSIHQQALIRMLAIASEYKLNPATLIIDLGAEMKSVTARKFEVVAAHLLEQVPIESALARVPGTIPEPAVLALAVTHAEGLQQPLNQTLLNSNSTEHHHNAHSEDNTLTDSVVGFAMQFLILSHILAFMMLFIIPQFKDMFNEFGFDLPLSMELFIDVNNKISRNWYIFFAISLLAIAYVIWKHPRFITNYFTRWIPGRWQQPVVTAKAQKDLGLAWVAQTSDDSNDAAIRLLSNRDFGARRSKRQAVVQKIETGTPVWEAIANGGIITNRVSKVVSTASTAQSANWILRQIGHKNRSKSRRYSLTKIRLLVWLLRTILILFVTWTAISFFQCLIVLIKGVADYA